MPEETPTLAPPASETTQETPPPSTPAVTPEVTTGAEVEAPPAPPEEAAPETPSKPWSSLTDEYEVLALDEFKPHLAERDSHTEARLKQVFQGQLEKTTKDWETTNTHQTINGLLGRFSSKLDESDFEGADRILSKLESFREPYMEPYRQKIRDETDQALGGQFLGLMENTLGPREAATLRQKATSGADWPSIVKKYADLVGDEREKKGFKGGLQERDNAQATQQQVKTAPAGANLEPGTAAGIATDLNQAREAYSKGEMTTSEAERLGIV